MLLRGVTLEGAEEGIKYYLKPDFSRLSDAQVLNTIPVLITSEWMTLDDVTGLV